MQRIRLSVLLAVLAVATAALLAQGMPVSAPTVGTDQAEAETPLIVPGDEQMQPDELDPAGLQRVPFPLPAPTCGDAVCGAGTYCCNASCSACAPFGASCTQEVCAPTS